MFLRTTIFSVCALFAVLHPVAADEGASEPVHGPALIAPSPSYSSQPIPDEMTATEPEATEPEAIELEATEPETEDQAAETAPAEKSKEEETTQQPDLAETEEADQAETPPVEKPEPEAKPPLSAEMAGLRDRVRRTMATYRRPLLNVREGTATEIMHNCLAFGCDTTVYLQGTSGKTLNGITCLCWNYPCSGFVPLGYSKGRIAPRIGHGLQEQPSQMLAVLALARVPSTYSLRVGEDVRTVADLVEYEKLSCRSGRDLSLKLIGLAFYVADGSTWQNDRGEEWSIERIVKEELARPVVTARHGGTQRLTGLSCAIYWREKRKQPVTGQFLRALKFVGEFHDYAMRLQNGDGSWGPAYFAGKLNSRNSTAQLRSTGHVLGWLAISLPEDQLGDARVVRAVQYVNRMLGSGRYRSGIRSMTTRDLAGVMHALHALDVYDRRYFQPRTPKPATPETTQQAAR